MKKIYFLFFTTILVFTGLKISAQVYTGGSLGVHYEDGIYVDASPLFGYRQGILDLGVAPFYAYREYDNRPSRYSYGNRIFMQLTFIPNVFAHAEFEVSNISTGVIGADGRQERKWITGLPLGGGYRYNLAPRTQAYGMILYDVMLDPDSPVKNPIIRGGMVFRL
jgi:hypothetical protein